MLPATQARRVVALAALRQVVAVCRPAVPSGWAVQQWSPMPV